MLPSSSAQSNAIASAVPQKAAGERGKILQAKLPIVLQDGFHVNSNAPIETYLIPLRLTWATGPLQVVEVLYPKPHTEKYEFSAKPLSVYTGSFEILTRFKVPADATRGMTSIAGKLRYQACTDRVCFPPKTLEVKLPVEIQ